MAQTKLTLANLATLVTNYINNSNILISSNDYVADREAYSNLIVKIGKQIMIDSNFTDRLGELDGEELPYGTTIEEYFINLLLAKDWDGDGADALAPDDPIFEDPYYSTELGRKTYKTTLRDNVYEKALLGTNEASAIASQVIKKWLDSRTVTKYGYKRQLLGKVADFVMADKAANPTRTTVHTHAMPTDVLTAESFIKLVKKRVTELRDFQTDSNNMGGVIAKAESLILYVKGSNLIPELDVEALAGAFNQSRVEIPVEVKALENFGQMDEDEDIFAILMDTRTARLHSHRLATDSQRNGEGEFTNYFAHETYTAFVSKFTNVNVFTINVY